MKTYTCDRCGKPAGEKDTFKDPENDAKSWLPVELAMTTHDHHGTRLPIFTKDLCGECCYALNKFMDGAKVVVPAPAPCGCDRQPCACE